MATKSTNAELHQRIAEVCELLLNGKTRHAIIKYCCKWEVSDTTVDNYIRKATELIREINQHSVKTNLALISTNLWKLYASHKESNPELARKVMMDLAKLHGLEQHSIVIEDKRELAEISNEALEAILAPSLELH